MKKKGNIVIFIAIILCLASMIMAFYKPSNSSFIESNTLNIKIFRVGKADAIVIDNGGEYMVIDVGEEEDGFEVIEYLEKKGVDKVKVLLITHFDKDHVGGADTFLEYIQAEEVILPDYVGVGTDYMDFMQTLNDLDIKPTYLHENKTFALGDSTITLNPPATYDVSLEHKEIDNDLSIITTIEHHDNRLVFLGDAEKKRLREYLSSGEALPCDFMKLPHHGVYNTELENLMDALQPTYIAICTSKKNPAETQTVQLLKSKGAKVAETKDGGIYVTSDGKDVYMNQKGE